MAQKRFDYLTGMFHVNMHIDSELWRQLSVRAAERGITKREAVETALREWLKNSARPEPLKRGKKKEVLQCRTKRFMLGRGSPDFRGGRKLGGDSLSGIIAEALRRFVDVKRAELWRCRSTCCM